MDDINKKKDDEVSVPSNRSTEFFANERTFLAWLRSSIAIIGLGFVVARFSLFLHEFGVIASKQVTNAVPPPAQIQNSLPSESPSSLLGISMVVLGILLLIYALVNYRKAHDTIESGRPYVSKHFIVYVGSLGLIGFGLIVVAYLLIISI